MLNYFFISNIQIKGNISPLKGYSYAIFFIDNTTVKKDF